MVQVNVQITKDELDYLHRLAVLRGYTREEPRRAWTYEEKKKSVRWAINLIIVDDVAKTMNAR